MFKKIVKSISVISVVFSLNAQAATEVVILLDVSGSTGALISNWQSRIQDEVFDVFLAADPDTRFGLASHVDFPYSPYGNTGDYGYRREVPLTTNTASVMLALNNLTSSGGGDSKESQIEAAYQSFVGNGLDLNNNGDFTDLGDIGPQLMGWNGGSNTKIIIHFTSPLTYHNDPVLEPNYPYAGVINNPATLVDVTNIVNAFPAVYTITPDLLPLSSSELLTSITTKKSKTIIDYMDVMQGYTEQDAELSAKIATTIPMPRIAVSATLTTAEKLATITGGDVLHIDSSLSGLDTIISTIIDAEDDKNGKCEFGETLVETPFGEYCIKV